MLSILPPELVLAVLSSLPIPSLHSLQLTSKEYDRFIRSNESSVYHNAAVLHRFIRSTTVGIDQLGNLEYGGGYSYRILDGIKSSWKIFCQRRIQLEKSWRGGAPSRLVNYPATGYIVHRIKVDEKNGFVIASTGFPLFEAQGAPALIVADMKNPDRILWSLPSTFVKQYAHIEYENGFLIFDRLSGQKEVWRLASVKDPHPPPAGEDIDKLPIPYPQKDQLSASFEAAASYAHTFPRGHFVPHALLNMPRKTRAFRFVYPTLLVGGFDHAFCFDVPSRQLVQTINPTQQPTMAVREEGRSDSETTVLPQLGELNYVELSPRHVFICGENSLRVFSRETGGCMLDFPSSFRSYGHRTIRVLGVGKDASDEETEDDRREREQYGRSREDSWSLIGVNTEVGEGKKASVVARLKTVEVNPEPEDHRSVLDEFTAVHVSACGNHLVAMLRTSRLVVIRNFSSIPFRTNRTNGEQYTQLLKENTIQIALGTQHSVSQYLAFDRGKVVAVSGAGVFILDVNAFLYPSAFSSPASPPQQPLVQAFRLPEFNDFVCLARITCVQISDSGLYLTWDTSRMRLSDGKWMVLPPRRRTTSNDAAGIVESDSDSERPSSMDIDPETDPLEVDEWVSTDDDSDDDGWSMFVDETGVLHHTGTLLKRAFFRDETAFRTLMEQPGKFRVLANGDLVVMGTNSPIPVGDDLERESTVCGVDFAVWDWGFGVDMGGSSR